MNLRYFYFRGYFAGLDYQKIIDGRAKTDKFMGEWFARKNRVLFDYMSPESAIELLAPTKNGLDKLEGYTEILLQTGGQGLLTGSGYAHETGSLGELKLGFHFDPTTGLPTLPGHSVKGVLRSVFPQFDKSRTDLLKPDLSKAAPIQEAKAKYVGQMLGLSKKDDGQPDFEKIHLIELAIFEGLDFEATQDARSEAEAAGKENLGKIYCTAPISKHDIFLEAAMTQVRQFLGRDALAPHDRKTGGLKNPVPIPFVKVLPGVVFRFAFLLKKSTIGDIEVSESAKKSLFETILTTFGAGAKTRGGYGVFEKIKSAPAAPKPNIGQSLLDKIPASRFKALPLKSSETYEAMVNGKNDKGKTRFVLLVGEVGKGLVFTQKWPTELAEGVIIQVRLVLNMNGQIQELNPII